VIGAADAASITVQRMDNKVAWFLWVLLAVAAVFAGIGYHQARMQLSAVQSSSLEQVRALLKADQDTLGALSAAGPNILIAYLAAIRADGVAKHADTKVKLDRLAENNAGILAIINVYKPHAKTAAFSAEAQRFQRYAIAWRDRWNSVMELFMAGGNYPVAEVPFPQEFAAAVDAEMAAAK
jgi:hypothetical protein